MPDLFSSCRLGHEFRPLSAEGHLSLDLRYAGPHNICGVDLYEGEKEAWLHQEAFEALRLCGQALAKERPGWRFRLYDATRPLSVQRKLFDVVAGTPQQAYVADPARGSVHNYGFAVDLGLEDECGREQDLGTSFDNFDDLAQPRFEAAFLAQGRLMPAHLDLRLLLRSLMLQGGFTQNPLEWWHFDKRPLEELKGRFPVVEGL